VTGVGSCGIETETLAEETVIARDAIKHVCAGPVDRIAEYCDEGFVDHVNGMINQISSPNRYTYASGDPIDGVDYTGLANCCTSGIGHLCKAAKKVDPKRAVTTGLDVAYMTASGCRSGRGLRRVGRPRLRRGVRRWRCSGTTASTHRAVQGLLSA
jgi:hypothetical protein